MKLRYLKLNNFKSYEHIELNFENDIVCFCGPNGIGKTNLLDAIHYLSLGKSFFNRQDSQNIKHTNDYFSIEGTFDWEEQAKSIFCGYQKGKKKVIKKNNVPYDKITDHIGRFPVVMLSPHEIELVLEGSEIRRKFMDRILSQIDHEYLKAVVKYNRTLNQRNKALKQLEEQARANQHLFEAYDQVLEETGVQIFNKRNWFIKEFKTQFLDFYSRITGNREAVDLTYNSQLFFKGLHQLLNEQISEDCYVGRTTNGIHKDDLDFNIDNYPLKKFGSQGQQKSFITALKLAEYKIIQEYNKTSPLLLLDDIYDRLDFHRIKLLLQLLSEQSFEQIFITDISQGRIRSSLESIKNAPEIHNLE